jgi:hypothetical protein
MSRLHVRQNGLSRPREAEKVTTKKSTFEMSPATIIMAQNFVSKLSAKENFLIQHCPHNLSAFDIHVWRICFLTN